MPRKPGTTTPKAQQRVAFMVSCPDCGNSRPVYRVIRLANGNMPPIQRRESSRCGECMEARRIDRYAPRGAGRISR